MAATNIHVKKPHANDVLTDHQVSEWLRCRDDPQYFYSNYVFIQHPSRGSVLFDPYDYQNRVLRSLNDNDRIIIMQPRQSGKSANIVAFLLHQTTFFPDFKVGVASKDRSGAKDLIGRFRYSYEHLPYWMKCGCTEYNKFSVEFDNGSSITSSATTEGTFRGSSLSLIYLDEFAFIPPSIADAFWISILPALSAGDSDPEGKNCKMIITSTPNSSEGKFAELWHESLSGENDFANVRVRNEEVPGRHEGSGFKEKTLKSMSSTQYRQEYGCEFLSDKGTLIQSEILEAIEPQSFIRRVDEVTIYGPLKHRRIALAVDTGKGIGQDYSVIQGVDIDTLEQVIEYRNNSIGLTAFSKKLIDVMAMLQKEGASELYYGIESNSIGQTIIELLEHSTHEVLDFAEAVNESGSKHRGLYMTIKSKFRACLKLKDLIECGAYTVKSAQSIKEFKFFVAYGDTFRAERGAHDDLVMGHVIMALVLEAIAEWDDTTYKRMRTLTPESDNLETEDWDYEESDESETGDFII